MFVIYLTSIVSISQSCKTCQTTCRAIRMLMKSGQSIDQIIDFVGKKCTYLSKEYQESCTKIINNIEKVMSNLENNIQSEKICEKYHLCEPTIVPRILDSNYVYDPSIIDNGFWCSSCTKFIDWLRPTAEDVSFKTVKKLVVETCPKYSMFKDFCKTITDQQITSLVQGILNNIKTDKICSWIKYCE